MPALKAARNSVGLTASQPNLYAAPRWSMCRRLVQQIRCSILVKACVHQTLAKGDKLTISVEGIDGGKLRCTSATWSDAVVILQGEALAIVNIERQAHAIRARAPGQAAAAGPAQPDPGEDDFEGEE
jgi:hypothetical protein